MFLSVETSQGAPVSNTRPAIQPHFMLCIAIPLSQCFRLRRLFSGCSYQSLRRAGSAEGRTGMTESLLSDCESGGSIRLCERDEQAFFPGGGEPMKEAHKRSFLLETG